MAAAVGVASDLGRSYMAAKQQTVTLCCSGMLVCHAASLHVSLLTDVGQTTCMVKCTEVNSSSCNNCGRSASITQDVVGMWPAQDGTDSGHRLGKGTHSLQIVLKPPCFCFKKCQRHKAVGLTSQGLQPAGR